MLSSAQVLSYVGFVDVIGAGFNPHMLSNRGLIEIQN